MAWLVFAGLFAGWVVGVIGGIGGSLIHVLLVAAVLILGRRLLADWRAAL